VDIIDDAALLFERAVDGVIGGRGFVESFAKFLGGFLKTLALTKESAVGLADDEAESGG